jgi:hypothetical protein
MRMMGLMIAAAVLATAPAGAAEWKEYAFPDLGVRKDFPSEPHRSEGTYKTTLVPETAAHIVSSGLPGVEYKMTVVPLPERSKAGDGATIMGECDYNAMLSGTKVLADMSTDIGGRQQKVYGRWASVNMANGNRKLTACYFTKGNLYIVDSVITPQAEDYPNAPEAFRFVNALDFNMDPNRDAPRPARPAGAPAAGAN